MTSERATCRKLIGAFLRDLSHSLEIGDNFASVFLGRDMEVYATANKITHKAEDEMLAIDPKDEFAALSQYLKQVENSQEEYSSFIPSGTLPFS